MSRVALNPSVHALKRDPFLALISRAVLLHILSKMKGVDSLRRGHLHNIDSREVSDFRELARLARLRGKLKARADRSYQAYFGRSMPVSEAEEEKFFSFLDEFYCRKLQRRRNNPITALQRKMLSTPLIGDLAILFRRSFEALASAVNNVHFMSDTKMQAKCERDRLAYEACIKEFMVVFDNTEELQDTRCTEKKTLGQ